MALLSILGKYSNIGLLVMRLGLGAMMILHGYPKLLGGPERWTKLGGAMANIGVDDYPIFWGFMAAITETLGGLFVILGLAFRPVCILLAFTMAVAAITHFHRGDGISGASHALELGFAYLGLVFVGAGKYAVDKS